MLDHLKKGMIAIQQYLDHLWGKKSYLFKRVNYNLIMKKDVAFFVFFFKCF